MARRLIVTVAIAFALQRARSPPLPSARPPLRLLHLLPVPCWREEDHSVPWAEFKARSTP